MTLELKKTFKNLLKILTKSAWVNNWLIPCLLYYYSVFVGKTTRWKKVGFDEFYEVWEKEQSVIMTGWHGRALLMPYFWNKKHPVNALVSLHQDGRIIAGVLERHGFGTVGGSTNGNARGAAVELMRSLKENISICITPDGPRGPRMKMSMSPLYFARKSGKPLFGMTYSIARSPVIKKAWDQMMLPLPFSKGIARASKPFYVPANATDAEMEVYRQQFEDILNEINVECDTQMGVEPTRPDLNGTCKLKRDHSWKID